MQVDNNTADTLYVVDLDVYDATAGATLADGRVRRTDFASTFTYQDFAIGFVSPGTHELEFRVHWNDYAYILIDRVTVR
jgi:hypothetical protein